MGGTSFDVGVIIDGEPTGSSETVINQYTFFMPRLDIESIGAGGLPLDRESALAALTRVGEQVELSALETADGALRIVESHMADLMRQMTVSGGGTRVISSSTPFVVPGERTPLSSRGSWAQLQDEGFTDDDIQITRPADMKFSLQIRHLEVAVPGGEIDGELAGNLVQRFHERYEEVYGAGSAFAA